MSHYLQGVRALASRASRKPLHFAVLLDRETIGFEAIHNVNSNSSNKSQLVGECGQAVEVCNILSDGHIQVVPPTAQTFFHDTK